MPDWIVPALLALNLLLLLWIALQAFGRLAPRPQIERLERELRDELGRQGQITRGDLGTFQQMLLAQGGDVARTQNEQIDSFRTQLAAMQQQTRRRAAPLQRDRWPSSCGCCREANERRLGEVRGAVETRLAALQEGNEKKLEQMRATVDEKLHATLEQRLGESFKQVAERLEQVHKGLGEMQGLARDVGSLNRVLTNVKTRGIFGEVQLAGLLEQVFTPEQYAANVATVPGSSERVEFAIRLPGQRARRRAAVAADRRQVPARGLRAPARRPGARRRRGRGSWRPRRIETRLRLEARTIRDKYVAPPHTTDFAILFVPTEGLYAEALRRPGLVRGAAARAQGHARRPDHAAGHADQPADGLSHAGAGEALGAEVWEVLGAVKTEFGKFGDVLAKTKKKLDEASSTIDAGRRRART